MKTRQAMRQVERLGGVLVRQRGSHRIYGLPGGGTVCIPFSGSHLELSPGLRHQLRRILGRRGRAGVGKEGEMNGP